MGHEILFQQMNEHFLYYFQLLHQKNTFKTIKTISTPFIIRFSKNFSAYFNERS
jgi:hypothetical protein